MFSYSHYFSKNHTNIFINIPSLPHIDHKIIACWAVKSHIVHHHNQQLQQAIQKSETLFSHLPPSFLKTKFQNDYVFKNLANHDYTWPSDDHMAIIIGDQIQTVDICHKKYYMAILMTIIVFVVFFSFYFDKNSEQKQQWYYGNSRT